MKSIGLLLVGHIDAGSLHIGGDYPELYRELLGPHGIDVVTYRCDEGQLPGSPGEQDGWMCSPSRMSVYDDADWLRDTEDFLRDIVRTEAQFVGICFGHQLLAQALGGTVRKADVGWGIGAKEYVVHEARDWMVPPRDIIRLAASHQDQVIEVPPDATVWAGSDYCPNGGMFVGDRAWTLQVHPEFSPALADSLLATRLALFGEDHAAAARATLTRTSLDQDLLAGWISAFFHGG